jgi:amidohydrolase
MNLRTWRSALHERAELAWQETRTRDYVVAQLKGLGLEPRCLAGTGVVADVIFERPGPCIGFRAELDALPFPSSDPEAASQGLIIARHACGHDMHAAMLLGLAQELICRRTVFTGRVRLLFQPAEEVLSEDSGAARLVAAGVLNNPRVEHIYALHVSPRLPAGDVACRAGVLMAECRRVTLTVKSRGGHGATVGSQTDPVIALARILSQLAEDAQEKDPGQGIASFCMVAGGTAANVRPMAVRAEGTARATVHGGAERHVNRLRDRVATLALNHPTLDISLDSVPGYPLLVNDDAAAALTVVALSDAVGSSRVHTMSPSLASEDFAFYLLHRPGAMFLLGIQDSKAVNTTLHSADFHAPNDVLETGVRCFVAIAERHLGGKQ